MAKKKKPLGRVRSSDPIERLVACGLLDVLTGTELAVYLRLVVAAERRGACLAGAGPIPVRNAELHRDARTAGRALAGLQDLGICRVRFDANLVRTVELT